MNVHDSEAIASYLEKLGFTKTDVLEQSDIVVLNTCAIRENAHDKVFGYLGRCKHLKKEKKDLIIVLILIHSYFFSDLLYDRTSSAF